ncbi:phage/plasmid replication domain-containing protein [Aeromonas salmonicida]|uniref:phage/plasmid replication domain-containing protein n=2 Tax=Aeromonas salmonicida TaxID=645 RepID=UPI0012F9A26F|nr:phage/plasmid replication protein [Aeromonas salmonicida]QOI94929.1 Replication-associated protein G2P [Aeromonas salmonicida subsp. masoucida]QYH26277.1 Replication-associated protein G2P [Aeromonas salmonicida subsp. masoucida]QYH30499.1 Replication-associated protein G2P [Aeromonas salmonicida subsp. masoucida]WCH53945.1 phage/plasmid replication protein [Aeromonas salmonicida]WGI41036.1 phage/plasmid replication protein [Aeromonas salmonicida]
MKRFTHDADLRGMVVLRSLGFQLVPFKLHRFRKQRHFVPQFTKCTRIFYEDGSAMKVIGADGAIIKGLHTTENFMVGAENEKKYISAVSTISYRNSVPHLFTNGYGCDWKSKKNNSALIYPCVYAKGNELELHSLSKVTKVFGPESDQVEHLQRVIDFCWAVGLVRYELKFKYRYLQREGLQYWGKSDYSRLETVMSEFTSLDKKLSVSNMKFETIAQQLYSAGVVDSTRAANTTALYALEWFHGEHFDLSKSQTKIHRARLRKIGIDIGRPCNISQFSPVKMVSCTEIHRQECLPPSWYQMPKLQLRIVA